jgi:hypothetical protein
MNHQHQIFLMTIIIIISGIIMIDCLCKKEGFTEGEDGQYDSDRDKKEDYKSTETKNCSELSGIQKAMCESKKEGEKKAKGQECNRKYLNKWNNWDFENINVRGTKYDCMNCVKYSDKVNVVVRNMGILDNYFAGSYCDAIAANCGRDSDKLFYANSHSHWELACSSPSNDIQSYLCLILDNSVFQYFLGFLSPMSCSLKIAAYKFKNDVSKKLKPLTDTMKSIKDALP